MGRSVPARGLRPLPRRPAGREYGIGNSLAPPHAVFGAARVLDLLSVRSPLFDAVTWVRGTPEREREKK